MDIRLDDSYGQVLDELMKRHGEKTRSGLTRLLIRDAARKANLWEEQGIIEPGVDAETQAVEVAQ